MITSEMIRRQFLQAAIEDPNSGYTNFSVPCGIDVGVAPESMKLGLSAELNSTLSVFGISMPEAGATIDWGALIAAVLPLIMQSFSPKSPGQDEVFYTYSTPEGSYCSVPKSFMDRCRTAEGKCCIALALKILNGGREVAGPIIDALISMLPALIPVLLPVLLSLCPK